MSTDVAAGWCRVLSGTDLSQLGYKYEKSDYNYNC